MAGISLSGLVSGSFDWKSVVDQLIQIESQPIARLQTEQAQNVDRLASLTGLKTGLAALQESAKALGADGLFNGRVASSTTTGSGWSAIAANDTIPGSYKIAVSQLATAARRVGAASVAGNLNAAATDLDPVTNPNGIAGLTLATLPTATSVTNGDSVFTINGQHITINSSDSLVSVFQKISDATGGNVTASYSASTDKVTLNSSSEIVLGASNDTSNFLQVMRLSNSGVAGSIASAAPLGSSSLTVPLANARLQGVLGVAADGVGSFAINGVTIDFNTTTDSLSTLLSRITASTAGVNASYDRAADRIVLTNKSTGDVGMSVSDITGTVASALGLTSGHTTVRGKNAEFTVNGGDVVSSASNTLSGDVLGVTGLSVTVTSETTETVNVAANTSAMKTAINDFISKFNNVQEYIDEETKITKSADGKVTTAILAGNHEVETWGSRLRSMAFASVAGLTGTIKQLENLGIDFNSSSSTLTVKDATKLDSALANNAADVGTFFRQPTTGFSAVIDSFITKTLDTRSGGMATQVNGINKQNTDIDTQIATLTRRIEQQREKLTNAFINMQNAQSIAQQQQSALENMMKQFNQDS